jgi:hypothetical protein
VDFILAFFIALVFVALAVYAVWKGEAPFRGPGRRRMRVRRSQNPVGFWLLVAMYVTIAALTIWIGARQAFVL